MTEKFKDILMNYVETEEINDSDEFKKDLGLASFDTVCLIAEMKSTLGISCEPSDFVKYKTVGEFYNNVIAK